MSQSILACIAFHYVPARLVWLGQVIACFARYDMPVRMVVHTNATDPDELGRIAALAPPAASKPLEVRPVAALPHPFELTWCHKAVVAGEFLAGDASHFVYVEDDILIAPEAFAYWTEWRPRLDRRGLVPGFVRVERGHESGTLFATDQMHRTQLDWVRMVRLGPWIFTNLDSAYTGSFILDRALAGEYVASASFDKSRSAAVKPNWAIRERAAMGMIFERVPRFFWSRLAVPFDPATLTVPDCAQVRHAPDNYANDPASHLAKIPLRDMLVRPSLRLFVRDRVRTAWRLARTLPRRVRRA